MIDESQAKVNLFGLIGGRLEEERGRLGLTQTDLGSIGGVERKAQGNYEAGRRTPDAAYLAAVLKRGVDVLYVLTGRREAKASAPTLLDHPVRPDTTQSGAPFIRDGAVVPAGGLLTAADASAARPLTLQLEIAGGAFREYRVIPNIRARAAAGRSGGQAISEQDLAADVAGVLAFERSYMREKLSRDSGDFATVEVVGDSMAPTLTDGETIVIDTLATRIDADGIYVITVGTALLVKRMQLLVDGSLDLKSDNPAYEPQRLAREVAQALKVIGRMVWPRRR